MLVESHVRCDFQFLCSPVKFLLQSSCSPLAVLCGPLRSSAFSAARKLFLWLSALDGSRCVDWRKLRILTAEGAEISRRFAEECRKRRSFMQFRVGISATVFLRRHSSAPCSAQSSQRPRASVRFESASKHRRATRRAHPGGKTSSPVGSTRASRFICWRKTDVSW